MNRNPANSHPLSNWPGPVAFVFSGGGSYGATQVGMLNALTEAGIVPDMVVGTSSGALNGVRFAADPQTAVAELTEIWKAMPKRGVFGGKTRIGTAISAARNGLKGNGSSLCSLDALAALIDQHITVDHIEDLAFATAIVVTDAQIGQPKLLTRGRINLALQASAAMPGVFPPVKIDGCFYVDGGVSANLPIRQAIAFGAKSVVVLDSTPRSMPGTIPSSVLGSIRHASMIMLRNQRADAVDDLVGRYPILQVPRVTPPGHDSFNFDDAAALIDNAYTSTANFLGQLPDLTDSSRRHAVTGDSPPPPTVPQAEPRTDQPPHSASQPPPDSRLKL